MISILKEPVAGSVFTVYPFSRSGKSLKSYSLIINDPDFGLMLFDTGASHEKDKLILFLHNEFNAEPDMVDWVFLTHAHPDHTGNTSLFKNAKILISKLDLEASINLAGVVYPYDHSRTRDLHQWSKFILGRAEDLLFIEENPPIPSIVKPIHTPGHTLNHYSYLVNFGNTELLVTGDALSNRLKLKSKEKSHKNEPHVDIELYNSSIEKISHYSCLLVPGHDRPFDPKTFRSVEEQVFTPEMISSKIN